MHLSGKILFGLVISCLFTFVLSCDEPYAPKPRGYFRIATPKQEYRPFQSDCPFEFELPTYATVSRDSAAKLSDCWLNVDFLPFKGTLYMSYKPVNGNLQQLADDCRNMAMKHTAKASGIDEKSYTDDVNQVFGLMYDLKGSAASPMQFWLTDSTHHFVRGSLYFYAVPNPDSIAPVLSQVRADLTHMIESFRWK